MIDPNAFSSQLQQQPNLLQQLYQMRAQKQEQQLRGQQIQQGGFTLKNLQQQQDADAADRAAQAKATTIGADGKIAFDRNVYQNELARGAASGRIITQQGAFLKQDQEAAKANLENQKAQLELADKHVQRWGALAGSAVDDPSWSRAVQSAVAEKIPGAEKYLNMPYDRGLVSQLQAQAVSAKEQIDQHLAQLQYADKQPGIVADSQKAVKVEAGTNAQGITAEQQQQNATTQRGQNMTAATAKRGQDAQYGAFQADIPPGTTGMQALMKMPPNMASTVQAIGDGKIDFATMTSRMPPAVKSNLAAAVLAYKPDYDQRNFGVGNAAMTAVAKSEVPKAIGDQKVAFNTMIDHASLLDEAAKALKNGNVQALAGLKNRFANEFGESGPITAQAIANAYSREVTSVLSKGHMTDSEIGTTGKTIDPDAQNYETLHSVLGAYKSLAQSKMNQLNKQEKDALNRVNGGNSGGNQSNGFNWDNHPVVK